MKAPKREPIRMSPRAAMGRAAPPSHKTYLADMATSATPRPRQEGAGEIGRWIAEDRAVRRRLGVGRWRAAGAR